MRVKSLAIIVCCWLSSLFWLVEYLGLQRQSTSSTHIAIVPPFNSQQPKDILFTSENSDMSRLRTAIAVAWAAGHQIQTGYHISALNGIQSAILCHAPLDEAPWRMLPSWMIPYVGSLNACVPMKVSSSYPVYMTILRDEADEVVCPIWYRRSALHRRLTARIAYGKSSHPDDRTSGHITSVILPGTSWIALPGHLE